MRTTSLQVGGVIELDASISVDPFIEIAAELVDEVCVPAGYTDQRLELIERWLSAHFYAIRDPRVANETARGIGQSFNLVHGYGFAGTQYGQQALRLDTAGGLAALDAAAQKGVNRKIGVTYLGRSQCE